MELVNDPFDASLALLPTCCVATACVVDLLRVTYAPEQVMTYRTAMASGSRFPPIGVLRVGRWLVIADGHKRFSAYRQLGRTDILVETWTWRRLAADQWRQVVSNARKNVRIVLALGRDPHEAMRLIASTLLHWRRVIISLARLFTAPAASRARRARSNPPSNS